MAIWMLRIGDLVPLVVAAVPVKYQTHRTVQDALNARQWTRDIQGGLSIIDRSLCALPTFGCCRRQEKLGSLSTV